MKKLILLILISPLKVCFFLINWLCPMSELGECTVVFCVVGLLVFLLPFFLLRCSAYTWICYGFFRGYFFYYEVLEVLLVWLSGDFEVGVLVVSGLLSWHPGRGIIWDCSFFLAASDFLDDWMSNFGKGLDVLSELVGYFWFSDKASRVFGMRCLLYYLTVLFKSVILMLLLKIFCRYKNGRIYAWYKVWILFLVLFFVLFFVQFCRRAELIDFKTLWRLLFWVLLLHSPQLELNYFCNSRKRILRLIGFLVFFYFVARWSIRGLEEPPKDCVTAYLYQHVGPFVGFN
ncbi:hypothetical protein KFK09_003615 [Dendrobium nobile]|uniref:Uncharacterized protein n=1 Tax=Dendrobium nobile TaxID=94219 RepID=A0A8T3C1T2_DENNO|nr:hypothetical protein KFK09_003615 [Dendrobium nobile]